MRPQLPGGDWELRKFISKYTEISSTNRR